MAVLKCNNKKKRIKNTLSLITFRLLIKNILFITPISITYTFTGIVNYYLQLITRHKSLDTVEIRLNY